MCWFYYGFFMLYLYFICMLFIFFVFLILSYFFNDYNEKWFKILYFFIIYDILCRSVLFGK